MSIALRTVLGDYGHVRPLRAGEVTVPGFRMEFVSVPDVAEAFPRMLSSEPEFDVCEVALGPYLLGRSLGKPVTAIPVIVTRDFQHALMVVCQKGAVREPRDLEGRRVGCRFYCQTSAIWTRGILASEYGVDLDRITWVVAEAEPVGGRFSYPPNVERGSGRSVAEMLQSGEVEAGVGLRAAPGTGIVPLIGGAHEAEAAWYKRTGIHPINHVLSLRKGLPAEHPGIVEAFFGAFLSARDLYLSRLPATGDPSPEDAGVVRQAAIVGGNPLPYGLGRNRSSLELLLAWAHKQDVTARAFTVDELFERP